MPESFVARFEFAWKKPTPDGLVALLDEDVILRQPHLPAIRGKAAAHREFTRLFSWIPGTHSIVRSSQESGDVAFIEHELRFPVGNKVIALPAVDRFVLRDGLGVERVVYFDQIRLILSVLKHPGLWLGYFRYRFGS